MDENTVRLLDLFRNYRPEQSVKKRLDDVRVFQADIDMKARRVLVTVQMEEYLSYETVRKIEAGIAGVYDIRQMELRPIYGQTVFPDMELSDLGDYLSAQFAPAMSILAGCRYLRRENTVTIELRGSGEEMLRPYISRAEKWLSDMFEMPVGVEVIAGADGNTEALFSATEKLRQKTVSDLPAVSAAKSEKRRVPAAAPSLIFGKAIKGDVIPMKDIQMDSGKVVVEGEVFAVAHRELSKSGAWVISFDMTDYTGSVRVNQYMETAKAAPILNGVSVGMWLKVQGKIAVSRFENDIVLQPYAIAEGKKPQRQDTADEKRVELHLHTQMSAMDALTDTKAAVALAAKW